ncbi:hypothetical protein JCM10212_005881 [Sporobolomyces blumeae]
MLRSFGSSPSRDKVTRSPDLHLNPRLTSRARASTTTLRRRIRAAGVALVVVAIVYLAYSVTYPSATTRGTASSSSSSSSGRRARDRPRLATILPSAANPFLPSSDPLPVHHDERLMIYHNTPVSPHRPPPNQFLLDPNANLDHPVVAIVTSTNDPRRREFLDTATTVFGQSIQNFAWIIVDDHSKDPDSLAVLADVARDPRVHLVRNEGTQGLAAGRNVGLDYVFSHYGGSNDSTSPSTGRVPPYLVSLDDDDLFEFTALEKSIWMLESNRDWDLAGFRYIKFGSSNETVLTGLHSNEDNYHKGNFVPNSAIYTSRSVERSGCRYDEVEFHDGGEDWDFWMCLAEHGFWGGSLIEPLYWYRVNSPSFRSSRWGNTFLTGFDSLKAHVQARHAALAKPGAFPRRKPKQNVQLEPVAWDMPYESGLARTDKAIVFIVPWMFVGGADIGALHMIQLYAEAGYRVTLVMTLSHPPDGIELVPQVLQYTHDVHLLPSFLRAHDFPRYLKHLVESRGARQVVLSNSQLVYEMLPALTEQMPEVEFIDYLHNEAYDGWKSGGYPRYSLIHQRYLARTITCSHYLKSWLLANGHLDASRIGVVKLGIEASHFEPSSPSVRDHAKETLLEVEPSTFVVTVVARMDPQKRSTLVPRIALELSKLVEDDFLIVMIGDGDLRKQVERLVDQLEVHEFVRVVGNKDDPKPYLAASDAFLLPSMSEGISVAVTEAMAMALPIVTARAGALPEQVGELDSEGRKKLDAALGGILVDHELDVEHDVPAYAKALASLILDPTTRRRLGQNARHLVETGLDWRTSLAEMFVETAKAENTENHAGDGKYPNPAAYLSTQMLLCENWQDVDMLGRYCFLEVASEMNLSPECAIIQHASDVLFVANHFFDNGIAFFTRLVNTSISWVTSGGEGRTPG